MRAAIAAAAEQFCVDAGALPEADAHSFVACQEGDAHDDDVALHEADHVKVPGSEASALQIHSMWRAMPRLVLQSRTHFSGFFRSMLSKPHRCHDRPLTAALWPMPLPYHFGRGRVSCDPNVTAFQRAINLQVAYLSYLRMNKPRAAPPWICGHHQLT